MGTIPFVGRASGGLWLRAGATAPVLAMVARGRDPLPTVNGFLLGRVVGHIPIFPLENQARKPAYRIPHFGGNWSTNASSQRNKLAALSPCLLVPD